MASLVRSPSLIVIHGVINQDRKQRAANLWYLLQTKKFCFRHILEFRVMWSHTLCSRHSWFLRQIKLFHGTRVRSGTNRRHLGKKKILQYFKLGKEKSCTAAFSCYYPGFHFKSIPFQLGDWGFHLVSCYGNESICNINTKIRRNKNAIYAF